MGGKALSIPSTRLSKSEYNSLLKTVLSKLESYHVKPILSYYSKQDFGDMDLLFNSTNFDPFIVATLLNATEVVRNGNVTSIGYQIQDQVFQIDLISVSPEIYDFAYHYYAFNDLGNFIGRIAHKFGFKFGHNGLLYQLYEKDSPTHLISEITVTTSFEQALTFLGFSYEQYVTGKNGGFDKLPDVFDFVIANPFFNRALFLLENRNAKARIRDTKRQSYMSFLKYIRNQNTGFDYLNYPNLKQQKLNEAFTIFTGFKQQYDKAIQQNEVRQQIKEKFNGKMLIELTGITGKELRVFINAFKSTFTNFDDYILQTSLDVIKQDIIDFHESFS
jgi:hypothetical protein